MRLSLPVPRVPLVPDPLRRAPVPRSLEAVTTVAAEADPRDGGMTTRATESVWRAVERFYRSGAHPAIQICLRREGEVVLDRAIGYARGNGPGDAGREPKRPATPETPFLIFSASKAMTAMVAHQGFGHLGFTNILGWADPERSLSGALITSGKPVLYPEIGEFWNTMRVIAAETPKTAASTLALP